MYKITYKEGDFEITYEATSIDEVIKLKNAAEQDEESISENKKKENYENYDFDDINGLVSAIDWIERNDIKCNVHVMGMIASDVISYLNKAYRNVPKGMKII